MKHTNHPRDPYGVYGGPTEPEEQQSKAKLTSDLLVSQRKLEEERNTATKRQGFLGQPAVRWMVKNPRVFKSGEIWVIWYEYGL